MECHVFVIKALDSNTPYRNVLKWVAKFVEAFFECGSVTCAFYVY